MNCAENYETMSKFVKVMPKILWPLFFRTRCKCSTFKLQIKLRVINMTGTLYHVCF